MSAALVHFGIASVLTIVVAILIVAVLFLRTVQRYVDLAENRLELLREGQALLIEVVRQQRQTSEKSRQQRPERRVRTPELVGQRTDAASVGSRRLEEPTRNTREASGGRLQAPQSEEERERRERTLEASTPGGSPPHPKDGAPPLSVKVPHPDDDVILRDRDASPARFFQKCYDRYLEHYEGYVRLCERIHQTQDEAEPSAGTLERQEWEDKLHRAYDAVERTTQRLDMLEEHYPELATDSDRISARIATARLHAGLAKRFGPAH